jgi:hypothetical protein
MESKYEFMNSWENIHIQDETILELWMKSSYVIGQNTCVPYVSDIWLVK